MPPVDPRVNHMAARLEAALVTPSGFRCDLAGSIASVAFTSGHRFVVGLWHHSPLGPMSDVMWARPDGEAPLARRLLGVRTFGTSPTGVFEWYRADQYRAVVEGRATLAGTDLGSVSRFDRPTGFGFSEPPRRPSVVRVRPMLVDPSGRLERLTNGGPLEHLASRGRARP